MIDGHKKCRTCLLMKPIRDFELPRHRVCTQCKRIRMGLEKRPKRKQPVDPDRAAFLALPERLRSRINARNRARLLAELRGLGPLGSRMRYCLRCHNDLPDKLFPSMRGRICRFCEADELTRYPQPLR